MTPRAVRPQRSAFGKRLWWQHGGGEAAGKALWRFLSRSVQETTGGIRAVALHIVGASYIFAVGRQRGWKEGKDLRTV